jgi:hypothetical protein
MLEYVDWDGMRMGGYIFEGKRFYVAELTKGIL